MNDILGNTCIEMRLGRVINVWSDGGQCVDTVGLCRAGA